MTENAAITPAADTDPSAEPALDPTIDPTADPLAALLAGNRRFVLGRAGHPHQSPARRTELAAAQSPFALVLGCADSRVPPEIVFDRGLGDLFVVRTAGHVVDDAVIGTVEYGVAVLGVRLVVVLGHRGCGAVRAGIDAGTGGAVPGGPVAHVVDRVLPSVRAAAEDGGATEEAVVAGHARRTAAHLPVASAELAARVADGRCAVAAMVYDVAGGRVSLID